MEHGDVMQSHTITAADLKEGLDGSAPSPLM